MGAEPNKARTALSDRKRHLSAVHHTIDLFGLEHNRVRLVLTAAGIEESRS